MFNLVSAVGYFRTRHDRGLEKGQDRTGHGIGNRRGDKGQDRADRRKQDQTGDRQAKGQRTEDRGQRTMDTA